MTIVMTAKDRALMTLKMKDNTIKIQELTTELIQAQEPLYTVQEVIDGFYSLDKEVDGENIILLNPISKSSLKEMLPSNAIYSKIVINKLKNSIQIWICFEKISNTVPNREYSGFIKP